jgi:hypothetical protein
VSEKRLMHVLQEEKRIVVFQMTMDGSHEVFSLGKPVTVVFPAYAEAEPVLTAWLSQHIGRILHPWPNSHPVKPGDPGYVRALGQVLSRDSLLGLWAYVTAASLQVSQSQLAAALGRESGPALRAEMEKRGLRFVTGPTGYLVDLGAVTRVLGSDVADRILLRRYQIASILGVSRQSVGRILCTLGLVRPGTGTSVVPWRSVRQIRRAGPRTFLLAN